MNKSRNTKSKSKSGIFFLGAPIRREQQREFENALLARFGGDAEKAYTYIEKVLDRQINKTRGILTSTSILAGVAIFVDSFFALLAAFVSILLLLSIFFVQWGRLPRYKTAEADFKATCQTCYSRSLIMSTAILLSVATIVLLLIKYLTVS